MSSVTICLRNAFSHNLGKVTNANSVLHIWKALPQLLLDLYISLEFVLYPKAFSVASKSPVEHQGPSCISFLVLHRSSKHWAVLLIRHARFDKHKDVMDVSHRGQSAQKQELCCRQQGLPCGQPGSQGLPPPGLRAQSSDSPGSMFCMD